MYAKRVVIRIRKVIAGLEGEIADGALRTALSMVRKEPGCVTVFLDFDAVSLADGQFDFMDQLSTDPETGNMRAISIRNLRAELAKFGTEGGKIVVSERWAKIRGFHRNTNTMVPGSVLTDDDGIAQMLLDATNVVDY